MKFNRSSTRQLLLAALCVSATTLAGCGGGGDDSPPAPAPAPVAAPQPVPTPAPLPPSTSLANQCRLDTEKRFVRSMVDEIYLWYRDVPTVDAASFSSLFTYFEALKTPLRTASGSLVDKFSFAVPQEQWDLADAGAEVSHGVKWQVNDADRSVVATDVEANSPAGRAGVQRGWQIAAINGVPLSQVTFDVVLRAVLEPGAGTTTNFTLLNRQGAQVNLALRAERVDYGLVPVTRVISTAQGPVGYLALRQWTVDAQDELATSVAALRQSQVRDLVLDLRYNQGGALIPVLQLAYMIGGDRVSDKVIGRIRANDKRPALAEDALALAFKVDTTAGRLLNDQPLPTLNLGRVFILSTEDTCSASEALINGLKPFLDVIQIGSTTCGKPYGFEGVSNCGVFYAPMELAISNAANQGDYSDGIAPRCAGQDELSRDLGDASEAMLRTALDFARTGTCPPPSSVAVARASAGRSAPLPKRPLQPERSSLRIDRSLPGLHTQ